MAEPFSINKYPHLICEWSLSNAVPADDGSVRATRHYLWLCPKGHGEFRATIANRAYHDSGCPLCGVERRVASAKGKVRRPIGGLTLSQRHPELVVLFDGQRNEVAVESVISGRTDWWWKCPSGHSWITRAGQVLTSLRLDADNNGCPECYLLSKRRPKPGQSLGDTRPHLVEIWHPTKNGDVTPFDVRPNCNDYAYWLCQRGHETHAIINSRSSGFECVHCRQFNKSKVEGDFRALFGESPLLTGVSPTAHRMAIGWTNLQDRQWMTVDIYGELRRHPQLKVVIEYDGKYFHDRPEVSARDVPKTQALLDAGYAVIRIRENGLAPVAMNHPRLLQINHDYRFKDEIGDLAATVRIVEDWLSVLDMAADLVAAGCLVPGWSGSAAARPDLPVHQAGRAGADLERGLPRSSI